MAKKKPALTDTQNSHVIRQVVLAAEFRMRMYKPQDWTEDPETLLSDLRVLMNWRSEVITDNAFTKVNKYVHTVHRDNSISMGQLFARIQDILNELRAITSMSSLPVDADKIEQLARLLDAIGEGNDKGADIYETSRLLDEQIRVMEKFCLHWKRTHSIVPKPLSTPMSESLELLKVPVKEVCKELVTLCDEMSLIHDPTAIHSAKERTVRLFEIMGSLPNRIVADSGVEQTTLLLQRMYGALPWWKEVFSKTPVDFEWPVISPDHIALLRQHGQLIRESASPVIVSKRTIIPAGLATAFFYLEQSLGNLLFWSTIPDSQPLTTEWLEAMRVEIYEKCSGALRSAEHHGRDAVLLQKINDARSLALELATLLQNSPDLSTIPRRQWTVPRECQLYDDLSALQREFKALSKIEGEVRTSGEGGEKNRWTSEQEAKARSLIHAGKVLKSSQLPRQLQINRQVAFDLYRHITGKAKKSHRSN